MDFAQGWNIELDQMKTEIWLLARDYLLYSSRT